MEEFSFLRSFTLRVSERLIHTVSTSPQLKVKVGWLCDRKHWLTLGSVTPYFAVFSCAFINRNAPAEQLLRRLRTD